ncbi:MAG: DsrE family protein [Desulfarculus sp.]|nr:DsrE family protein [Desulfarculus sp.]
MIDSVCAVLTRPRGEEKSVLGLRLAWATHMAGLGTCLLCLEDGVYNLLPGPGYPAEMLVNFIKESGRVLAAAGSLAQRHLDPSQLVEGVEVIPEAEIAALLKDHQSALVF